VPSDPNSPETTVLKALLALAQVRDYEVQSGDNLDYIIRQQFFVSAKLKTAYSLYLQRVRALNPSLQKQDLLTPGTLLHLPSGPQYGATEVARQNLPPDVADKTFLTMSGKAYFGPRNQNKVATGALGDKVTHSLGYIVARSSSQLAEIGPDDVLPQIKDRGILPPIDVETNPETQLLQAQPIRLIATDSPIDKQLVSALISSEKNGRLLPGSVPESQNISVNCGQCAPCSTLLKFPEHLDLSRASVLLEDTGIDNPQSLRFPNNVIYTPQGTDGRDISRNHHGTFNFNEIAASGRGPIPDNQIYIAKVASLSQGGVAFNVDDIIAAWSKFATTMRAKAVKANTWVANLSAAGEPAPDTRPPPSLIRDPNLLVVAAAGNGGSGISPAIEAFARLSNGNSNLVIVGALSQVGDLASYSNYHPSNVQILAVGDCTCGTPGQLNGTSQAAPLVTVAAAALASVRPEWYPSEVMWRLISTANRPASLRNKTLSGPVDLGRALTTGIIVRTETAPNTSTSESLGTRIEFDQEWTSQINNSGMGIDRAFVLLRLFDPNTVGGAVCFSAMRWQIFEEKPVCVSLGAKISLTVGQSIQSFSADHIQDIILPMDSDRIDNLPAISLKPKTN
jgi:subtilisin family serine protease